jgi:hypothetical protein
LRRWLPLLLPKPPFVTALFESAEQRVAVRRDHF